MLSCQSAGVRLAPADRAGQGATPPETGPGTPPGSAPDGIPAGGSGPSTNPAGLPTTYEHGNRLTPQGSSVDPILVEIVEGTLTSVEKEVETAIARTSRSPMIRDAHDFRAGIHDRQLRKLTGRSYSALVHPVVRDFPLAEMSEGDVFFHNDVYESEGGIGHLPDLCVTVPVFSEVSSSPSCRRSVTTTTSVAPCRARCRATHGRSSRKDSPCRRSSCGTEEFATRRHCAS